MHLVETIDAMGYGALSPTELQRFLNTKRAVARVSFSPYTEEVEGGSTSDDIATLLQLVYLKLTAPHLDAARFEANRTALKGYLASLWNSPLNRYEDFTMDMLSGGHPRAPRVPKAADLDQVDPARSVAMYRERFGNADGMTFVLVGSFEIAGMKPLMARFLGGPAILAATVAVPGRRAALSDGRHRPDAGGRLGQQRLEHRVQRRASVLARREASGSTRSPRCCGCGWSIAFAKSSEARTPRAS